MKLGMIVRMDKTGLGYQTRNLAYMLKPDYLMVINSTPFARDSSGNLSNPKQFPEWYESFNCMFINGFPTNADCAQFLKRVNKVLTCETPYNYNLLAQARRMGVATATQYNWEFCDYLNKPLLPKPTRFLTPSYWNLEEMKKRFKNTMYLPPPTFINDFADVRNTNFARSGRLKLLHFAGNPAAYDRNGTISVLECLKHTSRDFELTVTAQREMDIPIELFDHRVKFDFGNPDDREEIFRDYDAVILPRRYGGLCLPMNEALMSGLPVIMTDISPNNKVLPHKWLVKSEKIDVFQGRTPIDVFYADPIELAGKIDMLDDMSDEELSSAKLEAFEIGRENYSTEVLKPKYEAIFGKY